MFGISISGIKSDDYEDCINVCNEINASALQLVIAKSPYSSHSSIFTPSDYDIEIRERHSDVYLVCHGLYTANLCNRGRQFEYNKIEVIREMQICEKMMCDIVIHQGKNTDKPPLPLKDIIQIYVNHVTEIIRDSKTENVKVLLENSSHCGSDIGYNIEQLAEIYHRFPSDVKPRIGFCLDTCHAFVSGEMDLRSVDSVKTFLAKFDEKIGLENLIVVHLNDSKIDFGGKIDRHASWLFGYTTNPVIPTFSFDGLEYFITKMNELNIPMVLETDQEYYKHNIKFLEKLLVRKESESTMRDFDKFVLQTYSMSKEFYETNLYKHGK